MKKLYSRLRVLGIPFWFLWFGETISTFGTQLVQFALGVWIFKRTGSVLGFAGMTVASILPALIVMPMAGAVVDRLNRRNVVIIANSVIAIMSFALFFLVWTDKLEIAHMYMFAAVASLVGTFQGPAYQVLVSNMVHSDHLTRATGALGVSNTSIGVISPALAGTLLVAIGLSGIILLDIITFLVGTVFLWRSFVLTQYKAHELGNDNAVSVLVSSLKHFKDSMTYFDQDKQMLNLLFYSMLQAAMISLVFTMVVPLILAQYSSQALGVAMSFGAIGALLGNLLMVMLNSPSKRMVVILSCDAVLALCIAMAGYFTSLSAYCAMEFFASVAGSIAANCSFAIWMTRVPDRQRGSIMVMLSTVTMVSTAVFVILGGIVVDKFFEPALTANGALASTVGLLLGVGDGRGIALMFVISGILGASISVGGFAIKSLRELH